MATVSGFRVIHAGPNATLQDSGRYGVRRQGITQGGAVDMQARYWANWLVCNSQDAPVLEITFGGLKLEALENLHLALTGADLGASVDGQPLAPWERFRLSAGQSLEFSSPRCGLRAYLAVAGGFRAVPVLDSVSCVVRESIGGHDGEGRALVAGDELRVFDPARVSLDEPRYVPETERTDYRSPAVLDFVLGAQSGDFSGLSLFNFFNRSWQVDSRSDRMGVRLQGPVLKSSVSNLVSEGLGLGAVQVPPDGQPIVMLNDRQTIGGYPRLGTLPPLACARLAQCLPGQTVRFRPVPLSQAYRKHLDFLININPQLLSSDSFGGG